MNKDIKLQISKKPEYISVARLAISGLAFEMGFDVEKIEDLKVCIGEACINALNSSNKEDIEIEFEVNKDKIGIYVKGVKNSTDIESESLEEIQLGMLIIESLMDEIEIDNYGIKMVKYIKDDIQ